MRPERTRLAKDGALALLFLGLDLGFFWDRQVAESASTAAKSAVVIAAAVGFSALIWRRRAPLVVFGVLALHSLLVVASPLPGYYPAAGIWLALYTVAAERTSRRAQGFALLTAVAVLTPTVVRLLSDEKSPLNVAVLAGYYTAITVGVWCLGHWGGNHRRLVQRQREKEARAALAEERARIARELHDIVAHSVTIMLLQAAGARRVMAVDPEQAAAALAQVENAGSQAMTELRRMLMLLRAHETIPAQGTGVSSLAHLDRLLARVRAAGVPVQLAVQGQPRELDPGTDLAAYRTVQEALTNVTKHAGSGAVAMVSLRWGEDLRIEVVDDGCGVPHEAIRDWHDGHGLRGLEERLAVARGRLNYGPRATGGFRVTAWLPVVEPARAGAIVR